MRYRVCVLFADAPTIVTARGASAPDSSARVSAVVTRLTGQDGFAQLGEQVGRLAEVTLRAERATHI